MSKRKRYSVRDWFSNNPSIRAKSSRAFAPGNAKWVIRKVRMHDYEALEPDHIDPMTGIPQDFQDQVKDWGAHFSLFGTLNAWMLLVGPSPGNSPDESTLVNDLLDSAFHHRNPTFGWPHPSLYYPDKVGFLDTVRDLVIGSYSRAGILTNEYDALSQVLLVNLVKNHRGREQDIPPAEYESGVRKLFERVLPIVQPGLIIALTRGVFEKLISQATIVKDGHFQGLEPYIFPMPVGKPWALKSAILTLPNVNPAIVVTLPTHPSYLKNRLSGDFSNLDSYLANRINLIQHKHPSTFDW